MTHDRDRTSRRVDLDLFRETDQRLDERFEATEREIKALSAQTRAVEKLFTSQWGRLLEAMVEPGVGSSCSGPGGSRSTAA